MIDNIKIFEHSSVKINKIYIDPFKIDNNYNDAEYIFITHSHYDYYSIDDINKVVNDSTIFIIPLSMKNEYKYDNKVIYVEPNNKYSINDISFTTIPMYNINKEFHKKEYNWCGYNIKINDLLYYIVGDSDFIPEMNNITCDYIFIPIGGTYTMTLSEAINCLENINYKYVIPYHYGCIVGDKSLGNEMKKILGDKCILKIK